MGKGDKGTMKRAVALASGGLDSSTVLALARKQGFDVYALSFDYGQRHRCELAAARRIAHSLGIAHHVVASVDLRAFGGSALTADIEVPKSRALQEISAEIPVTYVPARNTIFLSMALGWCEVLHAQDIFIGVNAVDYSGYPDCRPEFLEAFERLANLATRAGVEGESRFQIHAPLLHMTKAQIIKAGIAAGVDYSLTHSCYDPTPEGFACGVCDSCILRRNGFMEAGVPDPTQYKSKS
jgi:7-cyano-7-deazaguanine synthase